MPARAPSEWCTRAGDASLLLPGVGLRACSSIVTGGDTVASLSLLSYQAISAGCELIDGDDLDHVSLLCHQPVDTLLCVVDPLVELGNLLVISDIALRRRLPRPYEGFVLPSESFHMCVQFVQVDGCCSQPVVVFRFQPPCECAAQAGHALPKRDCFGTLRLAELFLDQCDALAGAPFVRGRQIIRPRRGQHCV